MVSHVGRSGDGSAELGDSGRRADGAKGRWGEGKRVSHAQAALQVRCVRFDACSLALVMSVRDGHRTVSARKRLLVSPRWKKMNASPSLGGRRRGANQEAGVSRTRKSTTPGLACPSCRRAGCTAVRLDGVGRLEKSRRRGRIEQSIEALPSAREAGCRHTSSRSGFVSAVAIEHYNGE